MKILPAILFVIFRLVAGDLTPTAHTRINTASWCPPFISGNFSFSFSSSPGCGHPHFQIHCSSPHSLISINNVSFTILHHQPNTTSLYLSITNDTEQTSSSTSSSSCSPLLNCSIDLTNSSYWFADSVCNSLSSVKPCSPPINIPNCSVCSWECELLKTPLRLLYDCHRPLHHNISSQCDEHDNYFTNCKTCQHKYNGLRGFNSSDPRNYTSTGPKQVWIRGDYPNRIVLICTIFICSCILLVIGLLSLIYRLRLRNRNGNEHEEDPTMLFLHRHCSANLLPPVFSYEELESSTNRFDRRRKIGDGGFGTVYLGQLYDGRIVAVKKLHRPPLLGRATKSFCNEILILSSINHPNLVKLHGYCSDPRGLLLVYDYVPNGTLADHLHGSKNNTLLDVASLKSWEVRLEVGLQIAMALEYLHFSVQPAIVHRDITSANIFVEKDLAIKVGDFGLSRLLVYPPDSSSRGAGYICTGPQGTPGYLDPDYHRSFRLTEKSDVYSFGVVLFELISGMKAVDLSRDKREVSLADMVVLKIQIGSLDQIVDPVLKGDDAAGSVDAVAELAFRCVAADKDDRPDAREIVAELKRIKNRIPIQGGTRNLV